MRMRLVEHSNCTEQYQDKVKDYNMICAQAVDMKETEFGCYVSNINQLIKQLLNDQTKSCIFIFYIIRVTVDLPWYVEIW